MINNVVNFYQKFSVDEPTQLLWVLCIGVLIAGLGLFFIRLGRKKEVNRKRVTTMPIPENSVTPHLLLQADNTRQFALTQTPFTIGTAVGNELMIDDSFPKHDTISPVHARIVQQEIEQKLKYVIEDLNSSSGIRVNQQLTPKNLLRDGSVIMIGEVEFIFRQGDYV